MRDEVDDDDAPDSWGGARDGSDGSDGGDGGAPGANQTGASQTGAGDSARGEANMLSEPDAAHDTALDATFDAAFDELLRGLRAVSGPCAPPVGEGAFDILYASVREIVVWHLPAKEGQPQREVAIPGALARAAWKTLLRGEPVDEAALRALAHGPAGGRWLFALLAQVPGVVTQVVTRDVTHGELLSSEVSSEVSSEGESEPAGGPTAGEPVSVVALVWRGSGEQGAS